MLRDGKITVVIVNATGSAKPVPTGIHCSHASSLRRDCWRAKNIENLPCRSLTRQVEHRDCAARDHGRRQLAIPLLGLHEANERRVA